MKTFHKIKSIRATIRIILTMSVLPTAGCVDEIQPPVVTASAQEIVVPAEASSVPVTIRSTTSWTAYTYDQWLHLSQERGVGTTEIFVMSDACESVQQRTGEVTVTTESGQIWRIRVTQLGARGTLYSLSPRTVTIDADGTGKDIYGDSRKKEFGVKIEHEGTLVSASCDAEWISDIEAAVEGSSVRQPVAGARSIVYSFHAAKHAGAEERTAKINVEIEMGGRRVTEEVTVIQNGLGAPKLSTPENIYLDCTATEHKQSVWVEGGSQSNVEYKLYIAASGAGTGTSTVSSGSNPTSGEGWIESAEISDGVLTITTKPNQTEAAREGEILIVAFRGNSTNKVTVRVTQQGRGSAGIDLKNPVVSHGHKAVTGASLLLNPINNSSVEDITTAYPQWLSNVVVAPDHRALTYDLGAYDGLSGDYREANITLKASNGSRDSEYYTVTIRQYGPVSPGISEPPAMLTHNSPAVSNTIKLGVQNSSKVSVEVFGPADMISNAAIVDNTQLVYTLTAYNGEQGYCREGSITLKAANEHGNAAFYYITLRQYAPQAAGISTPPATVTHGSTDLNGSLSLNALNGSTLTVPATCGWLTALSITQEGTSSVWSLDYAMDAYTGDEEFREVAIPVTASNSHFNKAVYYVTIRQYGGDGPAVSTPVTSITVGAEGASWEKIPISPLNDSQVTDISSTVSWVNNIFFSNSEFEYSVDSYDGANGSSREGFIVITAEKGGKSAKYYIAVKQNA